MANNSEPAFPWSDGIHYQPGLSLRDYFAAKAFERLVEAHILASIDDLSKPDIAREAYSYADAMLAERAKENVNG